MEEDHDLSKFDCAKEDVEKEAQEFLITTALEYQNMNMAVTYLCRYKNEIVGYITLCSNSARFDEDQVDDIDERILHRDIPALKVAWIGVDKKFRKMGIATFMMLSVVDVALRLVSTIGIRIMTLDTREGLIEFFTKLGFKVINKERKEKSHPVMYFDLIKDSII